MARRRHAAMFATSPALATVVALATSFPGEPETRLRALVRHHIEEAATQEWPLMASRAETAATQEWPLMTSRAETLKLSDTPLTQALEFTLALAPNSQGQQTAQREIVTALGNAFDARWQRIITSQSKVNFIKWSSLYL